MIVEVKPIESLTIADLMVAAVWQYANRDGPGETLVRAVKSIPVNSMTGKVIGTRVRLANGTQAWALIGNVDADDPRRTEHFLTLSVEREGKWFFLARYHDSNYADHGPQALSRFLDMTVDEVFPISFDVRQYAKGDPAALQGSIPAKPRAELSRAEIIAMALS
jgi:hypothetical protein